jgi:nucleoside-diphosphate-sugar epimerase
LRLLLTGGSGFVGRHVVDLALQQGHEVVVLTRDPAAAGRVLGELAGTRARPAALRVLQVELQRPDDLLRVLPDSKPDVVVHLAALIRGPRAQLRAVNVMATGALVTALARLEPKPRIVFMSSFAVQDIPPTPYSNSKLVAEEHVRGSGLPWVILRPTLVYGPHDPGNTEQLVARMRAGKHWLPGGGRALIQPVHVRDVADAVLAAAQEPRALGRTYRLGGPEAVSVRDFRLAVRDATHGAAEFRSVPLPLFALGAYALALIGRSGPLGVLKFHGTDHVVDISSAQTQLGFQPRSLARGMSESFG